MALQFACSGCHELFPVELEETGAEKPCPRCGAAVALPAHPLSNGYFLGDWMVCGSLGVGRNGSIYQAQHIKTHTLAALRVPEDDLIGGPENVDAFCEQVSRVQGLKHPGIAQMLFSGSIGDVCFYGMEFCDGGCLPILLRHGRLDEDDAWRILAQLADGLAYLHRQGFFPRDLEPSKVVFDHDGNAKWSDFVLARPLRVNDGGASQPSAFGAPGYASPEQLRGEPADARSNLYSLGAIAFEMLTGQPPFARANDTDTVAAQMREPAPDASALAPVSHWTAVLVQRLLARDPAERFQNADHLVDALRASPPPPAPPRRVKVSIVKLATAPPQGGGPAPTVRMPKVRQPRPKVAGPAPPAASPKTAPRPAAKLRQSRGPLMALAGLLVAVLLVAGLIGWRLYRKQQLQREYDAEMTAERRRAAQAAIAAASEAARQDAAAKAAPKRTPADAPGTITLLASSAKLHGKTIRRGADNSSIGWWTTPDQWVEWQFTNDKAGKYTVVAELSATSSGKFEIVSGGKKLRCSSPKTGNYNKFQAVTLGVIELAAGDIALAVKPLQQGWKPMNLRILRLQPSE